MFEWSSCDIHEMRRRMDEIVLSHWHAHATNGPTDSAHSFKVDYYHWTKPSEKHKLHHQFAASQFNHSLSEMWLRLARFFAQHTKCVFTTSENETQLNLYELNFYTITDVVYVCVWFSLQMWLWVLVSRRALNKTVKFSFYILINFIDLFVS